jgi:hypothetical protein
MTTLRSRFTGLWTVLAGGTATADAESLPTAGSAEH